MVPGPHSPNVADASHSPDPVPRGAPVSVVATLRSADNVSKVTLIHCRVQGYACAPATLMTRGAGTAFTGRIPWNGAFFAGVTTVGYQFQIHYANGTVEQSPLDHVPFRPKDLPAEASVYYYYGLAEQSPGPGTALAVLALLGALTAARSRR